MKYIYIFSLPLFMTSCNFVESLNPVTLTILFAILLLSMIGMSFYVARKRKQADNTAVKFAHELRAALNKMDNVEEKKMFLNKTINQINSDQRYAKNTVWRDKILSKVYQELGAVYYKEGNQDKVLEICSKIIELEPNHMMSYYNRGTLYSNLGIYDKAEKDLTEAINLDSSYASSFNNRGMVYTELNNNEKAIEDYTRALEIEESPIIYYNRANAYTALGQKEKAIDDYKSALDIITDYHEDVRKDIEIALGKLQN